MLCTHPRDAFFWISKLLPPECHKAFLQLNALNTQIPNTAIGIGLRAPPFPTCSPQPTQLASINSQFKSPNATEESRQQRRSAPPPCTPPQPQRSVPRPQAANLKCGHFFGFRCIESHLKKAKMCPAAAGFRPSPQRRQATLYVFLYM